MKSKLLVIISLFFTLHATSQTQTIFISKKKIDHLSCEYSKIIENKTDTTYLVFVWFQNAKYTAIRDLKSVGFSKQKYLEEFSGALDSALTYIDDKEASIEWSNYTYRISKVHGYKYLSISGTDQDAYTLVTKGEAEKLSTWLKTITIGESN